MTEEARLKRIDESLVSLERLATDQAAVAQRLIARLDSGTAALSRMSDELGSQGVERARQGERLDRQLGELERQGERLDRQLDEFERRGRERRAESKMERETLLRIFERLDDIDPGRGRSSSSN